MVITTKSTHTQRKYKTSNPFDTIANTNTKPGERKSARWVGHLTWLSPPNQLIQIENTKDQNCYTPDNYTYEEEKITK